MYDGSASMAIPDLDHISSHAYSILNHTFYITVQHNNKETVYIGLSIKNLIEKKSRLNIEIRFMRIKRIAFLQ